MVILYDQTESDIKKKLGLFEALKQLHIQKEQPQFNWAVAIQIMLKTHGEGVVYTLLSSLKRAEAPS